jgi:hypothetical protein
VIEIKSRWDGRVIYTAENAQDVRQAVEEAVKRSADLGSADLGYADLRSADLGSADLRYANLGSADLGYADLGYADLRSADLRYADLGSADLGYADLGSADLGSADLRYAHLGSADLGYANLGSADLRSADLGYADLRYADLGYADLGYADLRSADQWRHPFWATRQDFFSILDRAPAEVAALRQVMVDGKIEGSTYTGTCSCLAGTIAVAHGCSITALNDELGIETSPSRPAEQWFISIREGDRPLDVSEESIDWKGQSEGVFRLSWALTWLDEWVESRTAIAKALEPSGSDR